MLYHTPVGHTIQPNYMVHHGDLRAVWIATWQAGCRRGSDPSRQVLKIDGLGCCLAKQLCLEAQPNRPLANR